MQVWKTRGACSIVVVVATLVFAPSCFEEEKPVGKYIVEKGATANVVPLPSGSPTSPQPPAVTAKVCADATDLPPLNASAGQIAISIDTTGVDPCSIKGFVVGSQEATSVKQAKDGTYYVENVPPGNPDLIVTAGAIAVGLVEPNISGIRVNDIRVEAGQKTNRPGVKLGAVGFIEGVAKLAGQTDHTGIQVYVPGTGYVAFTDSAGRYRINSVVPGIHDLRFEKLNFSPGVIAAVTVPVGDLVVAPEVTLRAQLGETQPMIVAPTTQPLTTRKVSYYLYPEGRPQLMQVSESPFFENTQFSVFKSSGEYVFPINETLRTTGRSVEALYVKLQENAVSSMLSREVVIDFFADIRGKQNVISLGGGKASLSGTLSVPVEILVPATAVAMQLSERDDFLGAEWVPTQAAVTYKFSSQTGLTNRQLFIHFKTAEEILSPVFQDTISLELFPAGSFTFSLAESELDAVYAPKAKVASVVSPLTEAAVAEFSWNADFAEVKPVDLPAATFLIDVPAVRNPCGTHTLHMRIVHKESQTRSSAVTQPFTYHCYRPISMTGASGLGERFDPSTTAADGKLFVWGGQNLNTGFVYDPRARSWSRMATAGAPAPRDISSEGERGFAGFAGDGRVVFYSGKPKFSSNASDSGVYQATTNTWAAIPRLPPELPDLEDPSFVDLRGRRLVVFGGTTSSSRDLHANEGAIHFLGSEAWHRMSNVNAPSPRVGFVESRYSSFSAAHLFTDQFLFVWGGQERNKQGPLVNTGAFYDFATDRWTVMSGVNAPTARKDHFMVWTGSKLLVWGGFNSASNVDVSVGGIFDPATNAWEVLKKAPEVRSTLNSYYAFADATRFFVWGGRVQGTESRAWSGLVYDFLKQEWGYANEEQAPVDPEGGFDTVQLPESKVSFWGEAAEVPASNSPQFAEYLSTYDPLLNRWRPFAIGPDQPVRSRRRVATLNLGPVQATYGGEFLENRFDKPVSGGTIVYDRLAALPLTQFTSEGEYYLPGTEVGVGFAIAPWQRSSGGVKVTAQIAGPATLINNVVQVGNVTGPVTVAAADGLKFKIANDAAANASVTLTLTVTSDEGPGGVYETKSYVGRPQLVVLSTTVNNNLGLKPGEEGDIKVQLRNIGGAAAANLTVVPGNCVESASVVGSTPVVSVGASTEVIVKTKVRADCAADAIAVVQFKAELMLTEAKAEFALSQRLSNYELAAVPVEVKRATPFEQEIVVGAGAFRAISVSAILHSDSIDDAKLELVPPEALLGEGVAAVTLVEELDDDELPYTVNFVFDSDTPALKPLIGKDLPGGWKLKISQDNASDELEIRALKVRIFTAAP